MSFNVGWWDLVFKVVYKWLLSDFYGQNRNNYSLHDCLGVKNCSLTQVESEITFCVLFSFAPRSSNHFMRT